MSRSFVRSRGTPIFASRCQPLMLKYILYIQRTKPLSGDSTHIDASCVGVMDNLLIIFLKEDKFTLFLDVADLFSNDKKVFKECIEEPGEKKCEDISLYDER